MAAGIFDAGTGLLAMRAKTEHTARESEFTGLWRERALETVRGGRGGDDHIVAEGYGGIDGWGLARLLCSVLYRLGLAVFRTLNAIPYFSGLLCKPPSLLLIKAIFTIRYLVRCSYGSQTDCTC